MNKHIAHYHGGPLDGAIHEHTGSQEPFLNVGPHLSNINEVLSTLIAQELGTTSIVVAARPCVFVASEDTVKNLIKDGATFYVWAIGWVGTNADYSIYMHYPMYIGLGESNQYIETCGDELRKKYDD